MQTTRVTLFKPYEFVVGQKINIESGPRRGDWKVVAVNDRKITLQCPISLKEVTWDRFCYFVDERDGVVWPQKDDTVT